MSKNYFYRDPRDALSMSRHGMSFVTEDGLCYPVADIAYFASALFSTQSPSDPVPEECFYIHPDDHHILEPQVGDLIEMADYYGVILKTADNYTTLYHKPFNDKEKNQFTGSNEILKIIQRNGLAFTWPEEEATE